MPAPCLVDWPLSACAQLGFQQLPSTAGTERRLAQPRESEEILNRMRDISELLLGEATPILSTLKITWISPRGTGTADGVTLHFYREVPSLAN